MYGDIHYAPQQRPWIAPSTEWAPTAPYYGEELAHLTSMTPFRASDFVPVVQQSGLPSCVSFDWGGATDWKTWLQDTVSNISGATGIRQGLKSGIGPGDPAVIKLQNGLELLGHSVGPEGADGWFMGDTDKALRAFQLAKGLPQTGVTDKETTRALNRALALTKSLQNLSQLPGAPGAAPLPPAPPYNAGASAPMKLGTGGKVAIGVVIVGLVGWALWPKD